MHILLPTLLLATALCLIQTAAIARDEIHCRGAQTLGKREGEYARKDIWDALPRAVDWHALEPQLAKGTVLSVTIGASGSYYASGNGWHEGIPACIKLPANSNGSVWAAAAHLDGGEDQPVAEATRGATWEGPFIRIGPAHAAQRLFFHRLFGTGCYRTQRGGLWCFGPGYIEHESHSYSAELVLDRGEMPGRGFPVLATEHGSKADRLWVFVRHGEGWQVFEEKLKLDDRRADKAVRRPWLTISRLPG